MRVLSSRMAGFETHLRAIGAIRMCNINHKNV
jgi:hypothetical protein